jgi:hypothetical protein
VNAQDADTQVPGSRRAILGEFSLLSHHVTGTVNEADCEVCHAHNYDDGTTIHTHKDGFITLWNVDDHNATPIQLSKYANPFTDTAEAAKLTQFCLNCHDTDGAAAEAAPSAPFTGSGAPPKIKDNPDHWTPSSHNTGGDGTTSPVSCFGDGTGGCHASGHGSQKNFMLAPYDDPAVDPYRSKEREDFCFTCHDTTGGPGMSTFKIQDDFSLAPIEAVAGTGALVNNRHDVLATDRARSGGIVTCKNCHSPHASNSGDLVVNPDTKAFLDNYSIDNSHTYPDPLDLPNLVTLTYYDGTDSYPDLDPTSPLGGSPQTEKDYIQFCLVCHDGETPDGVTMSNSMLNMAQSYRVDDQHGRLEGRSSASRGYLKEPWASAADYAAESQPNGGNGTYAALNCTLCHGPHGSGNVFNLRTSITVNGQAMTVGGKDAFTDPALCSRQCDDIMNALPEFGTTEYTLPAQNSLDWGAWCTFCHEPSHGAADGLACQPGHLHGGGNF